MPQHIKITVSRKTLFEDSFQQVKRPAVTQSSLNTGEVCFNIALCAIQRMCFPFSASSWSHVDLVLIKLHRQRNRNIPIYSKVMRSIVKWQREKYWTCLFNAWSLCFAMTALRCFLYEETHLSQCSGGIWDILPNRQSLDLEDSRKLAGEAWSSVPSTTVLQCLSLVIGWAVPSPLFSSSGIRWQSRTQCVLCCCRPVGRVTCISSSLSWWMATDSSKATPVAFLHSSSLW